MMLVLRTKVGSSWTTTNFKYIWVGLDYLLSWDSVLIYNFLMYNWMFYLHIQKFQPSQTLGTLIKITDWQAVKIWILGQYLAREMLAVLTFFLFLGENDSVISDRKRIRRSLVSELNTELWRDEKFGPQGLWLT